MVSLVIVPGGHCCGSKEAGIESVLACVRRSDLLNDDCGIIEYSVQLQLRLCLSETSAEQSDACLLYTSDAADE